MAALAFIEPVGHSVGDDSRLPSAGDWYDDLVGHGRHVLDVVVHVNEEESRPHWGPQHQAETGVITQVRGGSQQGVVPGGLEWYWWTECKKRGMEWNIKICVGLHEYPLTANRLHRGGISIHLNASKPGKNETVKSYHLYILSSCTNI